MQKKPGPGTNSPNPITDIPLYRSPRNNPENNAAEKSGTDLFARRAPDSTVSFRLRDWSGKSGETNACTPVSEEFAVRFIRELCCTGEAVTGLEHGNVAEYLPGLCWAVPKEYAGPEDKSTAERGSGR